MVPNSSTVILTIDVEDWFQVENFKPWIARGSWDSLELRLERNTNVLLDLLDTYGIHATFFTLGWVAERLPDLVREIRRRGSEVASHGNNHELFRGRKERDQTEDLRRSKQILEDILGERIEGFRAPSFSFDGRLLEKIQSAGYAYDSSFNSFSAHGRYGRISVGNLRKHGIAIEYRDSFYELPVSNIRLFGLTIPWGGGAYFRIMPFALFKWGVRRLLRTQGAYLFYLHPWEIDPEQPRVDEASLSSRLKHYANLQETQARLSSLIEYMDGSRFQTCSEYLGEAVNKGRMQVPENGHDV